MIKEISELIRFFWKTPDEDKSIVFYSEHEGYYPVFEGIINELINKHKKTLCYITSDPNDPILQTTEPRIKTFYVNKFLILFMSLVNCKVFVMTLTDLNQYHLKRSVNPVHYAYMFHSPVSTTLAYLPGSFDYYDSILCVGPYQIEEIKQNEELNNLAPKNLVKAGYCVIEKIAKEYGRTEMWAVANYEVNVWEKTSANGKGKNVGKMRCNSRALIIDRSGEDYKILSPLDKSIGWVNKVQIENTIYQNLNTNIIVVPHS